MENIIILPDSIGRINQTIEIINPTNSQSVFQMIYSSAMIIIALANICLVIYIFLQNKDSNEKNNDKNRRINLLKTLILDYNMSEFYLFFKQIKIESKKLQNKNQNLIDKSTINETIKDFAVEFRQDFIDVFIAIDNTLYQKILTKTDLLIDKITETIFDEGINLSHQPKYDELITKRLNESKVEIISILFSYSGE